MSHIALPSKYTPGWYGSDGENVPAKRGQKFDTLREMLEAIYPTDAHAVMYDHPGSYRLNKASLRHFHAEEKPLPELTSIFIDVDTPDHVPLEEAPASWFKSIRQSILNIPELQHAGIYYTRRGMRFVWPLEEPIDVERGEHYLAQFIDYLNSHGLDCDPLSDWTRVMRLPFVVRDGTPQRHDHNFDRMAPLAWRAPEPLKKFGSPAMMGNASRTEMPDPALLKKRTLGSLTPLSDKWYYTILREELPIADEGARHVRFVAVAADIAKTIETNDPLTIFNLLVPVWDASFASGRRPYTELWSICMWAACIQDGSQKEIDQRAEETLTKASEALGVTVEEVESRLILSTRSGSEFYVFSEEKLDYETAISGKDLLLARLEQGVPTIASQIRSQKGVALSDRELLSRFSAPISKVVADYSVQKSKYDPVNEVFTYAAAPIDATLQPRFDEDIDRWLRAIGGDHREQFLDWLATFLVLDRATCAIYIHADDGVGKGMLASGLSRFWGTSPVPYSALLKQFQGELAKVPFVVADESVPNDMFSQSDSSIFRRIIGNGTHKVDRKYLAMADIHGFPRILITANNPDALRIRESLTQQDITAIQKRIGYIYLQSEPKDLLLEMAREKGVPVQDMTQAWVKGGGIAEHVLWLQENREVQRGDRYLVEGWESSLTENMVVTYGCAPEIIRFITLLVLSGQTCEGILYGNGKIEANVDSVRKNWQRIVGAHSRPPEDQDIINTLQAMSIGKVRKRVSSSSHAVHFWQLDVDLIARGSEVHSIADEAEIRAAVSAPPAGERLIQGGKSGSETA